MTCYLVEYTDGYRTTVVAETTDAARRLAYKRRPSATIARLAPAPALEAAR